MMQYELIIVLLLLLIGCAAVMSRLDAKQRRINQQVAKSMPQSVTQSHLSLRRQQTQTKWHARLFNYNHGTVYLIRAEYGYLVGLIIALGISYVGIVILGFAVVYVIIGSFIVAIFVIRAIFGWQQHRFRNQLFRQLPDVVELITSTVRAGLPINEAFRIVAKEMPEPTAGQFTIVCTEMGLGRPPEEALEGVYHRTQVAEYGMFAVTLAVQMRSGGTLAETLQTLGHTVRQRVGMAGRARALAGEVIFSSRALSASPIVIGGGLYLINPTTIDKLFSDPTGRMLFAYAVVSVVIGIGVIRWMVKRETTI
jgi:tight adherence protein B